MEYYRVTELPIDYMTNILHCTNTLFHRYNSTETKRKPDPDPG